MSDSDLFAAVAHVTGEDFREIRRRGFMLAGPEESGSDIDPECMLDLIDLPESGTVDWDAVLGDGGFRTPFYARAQQARRKAKAEAKAGTTKQIARAA